MTKIEKFNKKIKHKKFYLIFKSDFENVRTVSDIKSLKLSNIKHRHKLRTKPYIGNFSMFDFRLRKII